MQPARPALPAIPPRCSADGWLRSRKPRRSPFFFTLGTLVCVLYLRRFYPRLPASIIALGLSIGVARVFQLSDAGLQRVADLAPLPTGLPPLTVPHLDQWAGLLPTAIACAVLSLVESSSVARTLAAKSGQRLDMAAEFSGQGLANIAAAFSGGYPVSGSLARSTLNQQAGAQSRLSALFCGLLMLAVLLVLGPVVNQAPIASLAGLLFVLASDLINGERIRMILRGTRGDRVAFSRHAGRDVARTARPSHLYWRRDQYSPLFTPRPTAHRPREMTIGEKGRFREVDHEQEERGAALFRYSYPQPDGPIIFCGPAENFKPRLSACRPNLISVSLFSASARRRAWISPSPACSNPANVSWRAPVKPSLVLGLRPEAMQLFEKTGIAARIGPANLFPAQSGWFTALEAALRRALTLAGEHSCGTHCPFATYLSAQEALRVNSEEG